MWGALADTSGNQPPGVTGLTALEAKYP